MSESTNLNGKGRTSTHPLDVYSELRTQQRQSGEVTDKKLAAAKERLDDLKAERRECMHAASDHAGTLGLVYRADSNDYVRMVSAETRPARPEPPRRPEPPLAAPAPLPLATSPTKRGIGHVLAESIHWILAIPVGIFVGYGLGTLTGLPIQRQPALLAMALLIGVCAVFGTKVFLGKLWHSLGLQKARKELTGWNFWGGVLVSLVVCGVEASLGAMALVIYSNRVAFDENQRLGYAVALPMAMAISTCVLMVSAVSGYGHGQKSLTSVDDQERLYQHQLEEHKRQVEHVDAQHQLEHDEWLGHVTRLEADHSAELQRFQQEKELFESTKNGADFQALLKYIGRISVLNGEIVEVQDELATLTQNHGKVSVY